MSTQSDWQKHLDANKQIEDFQGRAPSKATSGSQVPFYVLGAGVTCFAGFLFKQRMSGQSFAYAFGEARVKAQACALLGLVSFGACMQLTEEKPSRE